MISTLRKPHTDVITQASSISSVNIDQIRSKVDQSKVGLMSLPAKHNSAER